MKEDKYAQHIGFISESRRIFVYLKTETRINSTHTNWLAIPRRSPYPHAFGTKCGAGSYNSLCSHGGQRWRGFGSPEF